MPLKMCGWPQPLRIVDTIELSIIWPSWAKVEISAVAVDGSVTHRKKNRNKKKTNYGKLNVFSRDWLKWQNQMEIMICHHQSCHNAVRPEFGLIDLCVTVVSHWHSHVEHPQISRRKTKRHKAKQRAVTSHTWFVAVFPVKGKHVVYINVSIRSYFVRRENKVKKESTAFVCCSIKVSDTQRVPLFRGWRWTSGRQAQLSHSFRMRRVVRVLKMRSRVSTKCSKWHLVSLSSLMVFTRQRAVFGDKNSKRTQRPNIETKINTKMKQIKWTIHSLEHLIANSNFQIDFIIIVLDCYIVLSSFCAQ